MQDLEQHEIIEEIYLCDSMGNLNPKAAGWSRKPLQICILSRHFPRKKKWNYWCITNDTCMFSATISDVDYVGLVFVYYMDFKTLEFEEDTLIIPLGKGIKMGERVHENAVYKGKKAHLEFTYSNDEVLLHIHWNNFHGRVLQATIKVNIPSNHDTLNVVVPWSKTKFQYTSKQHCLPAEGTFSTGNKTYVFDKTNSFACLDFGRGIWPYSISWNWGAFSAKTGGHTIGFNMGDKWTDGTGITENAVCVDGHLYKIKEPLKLAYDNQNFMKPWRITSTKSDMIELTFTPFNERVAKSNLLIVQSEVHQCFGKYSGTIKIEDKTISIQDAIGWAEEHFAKW
jgi:hypothetical protein